MKGAPRRAFIWSDTLVSSAATRNSARVSCLSRPKIPRRTVHSQGDQLELLGEEDDGAPKALRHRWACERTSCPVSATTAKRDRLPRSPRDSNLRPADSNGCGCAPILQAVGLQLPPSRPRPFGLRAPGEGYCASGRAAE
jgi:hypothetical protein